MTEQAIQQNTQQATPKKVQKTDAEWRAELPTETYDIVRGKGTEPAFTGEYWNLKEAGMYLCAACGEELFNSGTKYDSGSGWPSFSAPAAAKKIEQHADTSHGLNRTEVTCSRCDAHLGHVFPDGPPETGLRYCINSASLKFKKA
ncbi:MAG: peptide-methionine (R)-S-oxide reductase MsrB [Pseudohongiellaceae bacterium]